MSRATKRPLWRTLFVCIATPTMAGCGSSFSRPPDMGAVSGMHQVRYSVSCEECQVTYTTGIEFTTESMKGSWSRSVRIDATVSRMITLTASPARSGILVRRARIEVDGRQMAQGGREEMQAFGDEVTLTVVLGSQGSRRDE